MGLFRHGTVGFINWLDLSQQLICAELDDLRRIDVVITLANPGRAHRHAKTVRDEIQLGVVLALR
jgi:hypothetical protein